MKSPYASKEEIDEWYESPVLGLAKGIRTEIARKGLTRFKASQHLAHYAVMLEAANAIKRNLSACLKLRETPVLYGITELVALS